LWGKVGISNYKCYRDNNQELLFLVLIRGRAAGSISEVDKDIHIRK
jgi:hypothetical protein